MACKTYRSDKARFEVRIGDSRGRVICKIHEALQVDCLKRKVKFSASVMVWGIMSPKGIGKVHFIEETVDTNKYLYILEESLSPVMEEYLTSGQDFVLKQDGAGRYKSKKP